MKQKIRRIIMGWGLCPLALFASIETKAAPPIDAFSSKRLVDEVTVATRRDGKSALRGTFFTANAGYLTLFVDTRKRNGRSCKLKPLFPVLRSCVGSDALLSHT